jgi:hypothetical protein
LNSTFAQSLHFFYIDKSNSTKLELLRKDVKATLDSARDNRLLYISNDKTPIIASDENDIDEALNNLGYIRPNAPSSHFDIDTLNSLLSPFIGSAIKFHFHFFLDPNQAIDKKQIVLLVERILLCNDLMRKSNCTVYLHVNQLELLKKNNLGNLLSLIEENSQIELFAY